MQQKFKKRYQLWILDSGNNYSFQEFDTLEEVVAAEKHSDWFITQRVNLKIIDVDQLADMILEVNKIQHQE